MFERRWITWGLAGALALSGCDDGKQAPPTDGPGDNPATAGLRLDEAQIAATPREGGLGVQLILQRTGAGDAAGAVTVSLHRLGEDAALATASADFLADQDRATVDVELALAEDLGLADPSTLANFVLRYRVTWEGAPLWGRRSLFAAAKLAEAQLLASDTFQVDVPAFVRLMTRDPNSGEALGDLPVTVGIERGEGDALEFVPLFEGRTDALGQVAAQLQPGEDLVGDGNLVVRVDTPTGEQELRAQVAVERATKVLVTTDKPLYQPGQTMHLRALALRRPNLGPDADTKVIWEIFDGKDNKVERVETRTDDFGVTSFQFKLAREVNMGRYRIVATVGDTVTEKTVTVDRYVLPKFDLDLDLDRAVYFAGDRVVGTVRARYFFGEPVAGGTVALSASTIDAGETVFANLQGATNDEGLYQFEIQVPEYIVGQPLEQGGGLINLALEVTDTAGQARTASRLVRIARGPLELAVVPESGSHVPGVAQKLLLRTTDAAGAPTAATVQLTVNGNALEPVETNANGLGFVRVVAFEPQLDIQATASKDADEITEQFQFAAGDPAPEGSLLVRTDRALYRVGDTLRFEAHVAGAPDRLFVDVIRGGQTVLTDTLTLDDEGTGRYELTLTPDHAGPLKLSAYYLAQGSSLRRDSATVYVDLANDLQVSFETDRDTYAPGDEATLNVRITDAEGNPQVAAVGLQGVDEAVYSLMEFRPGLENTYFRIEGELGEPRYQIGVPGLATLVSGGNAVDDAQRQAEAEMLFAASGDGATHPVAINTYKAAKAAVPGIVRPVIQAQLNAFTQPLVEAIQSSPEPWNFDIAGWAARNGRNVFDPWGQRMQVDTPDQYSLRFQSAGPDEVAGTEDDVSVTSNVGQQAFPAAEDDFDGAGGPGGGFNGDPAPAPPGEPEAGAGGDRGGAQGVRVRRNFPETLFVEPALITGADGTATMQIPLADSITTWRVSALANSAGGLLGSGDSGIRVFQDFFVDIDFPATLTRGDEFHVPVAVYNYLDAPQVVTLTVQDGDWFSLLGDGVIQLPLEAGEVAGVRIPVRVERVGLHDLTIIAQGGELADGVARTVLVEPDGQKIEGVVSGSLQDVVEHTVTIPADSVENSGKLLVKLYPGVFSQVVEGLDGILRMPSGCFEQTSSSTWPNVLVARYMDESGVGSPEAMATAMQYINTGYQRLLTFEVDGGGFEWFGNPPSHTVLTAYGLLEFTDMAQVRVVDEAMMARTRAWLLSQQKDDGRWETTRGYDETGQLSDPVPVTAYVAFALAASGEDSDALARAQQYLEGHFAEMGTYSTALAANFMATWRPQDAFTQRLIGKLSDTIQEAIQDQAGQHWQTDEQTTTYGMGEPAFIETTALATHALLVARAQPQLTEQALAWLVTKKSPGGAWGSTAGTVWTIKCLLKSLEGGRDDNANATVRILLDGDERASFQVTPETSDVMRQADLSQWLLPGVPHQLTIIREGEGNLNYGVVTVHHQPWAESPPAEGPLSISVDYDRTDLAVDDTVTATVVVQNNDLDFADMVMLDLGIPPGFELVRADLDALAGGNQFRRYEATQRQLIVYLDAIMPGEPFEFSYRLVARDPIRAQAPRSRVYSYYNPDVGQEAEPIEFAVD